MLLPYPYRTYKKVSDISVDDLNDMNIKGIILDIDGTLMKTKDKWPEETVVHWIKSLKDNDIEIYVLSNNKHPDRVKQFADYIGSDWTYLARKPFKKGFLNAAATIGIEPSQIGVVGDQIFTDMLGARLCGMKGLIVDSMDTYLWYYYPRHILEKVFWKEKRK